MPSTSVAYVVDQLAADIQGGKLAPGTALPTHRQLAAIHGMAIASASKVYAQLKAMGMVVGETGRGTFVRDRPAQREWDSSDEARLNANTTDLSFNHPTWPGQADLLRTMLRNLAASGDLATLMRQQPPGGRRHERQIVADFLTSQRGIDADERHVFLVNGAQQGLDIVARALLEPHDKVAVDALTYPGFRMLAEHLRLHLQPIPGHPDGPDLNALENICRQHRIRAIYTMPTLQNPLGWVLSTEQRQRLVGIARQHDCLLIEDASYAFLVDPAPPALATLAPERTVYVSSLSKSLASGLRFGFVVAPDACAGRIKSAIRASYWSMPSLLTAMATRWIADGTVARQEAMLRQDAFDRQAIAREVLAGMDIITHPASMFLWMNLPEDLRMDRIATALARRGIAVSKAQAYATTRHAPHALRLGLSSLPTAQLRSVLMQVRDTIDRFPI
ncbi:PLP-dependent aminotransferase family protein [Pigmentiphaga aceris]|uniref:PLP-dependent aminotransferase family protein n=1 Tax=Pigmentiphaga aceris TaxID=1940612 RepID=A0A5C0AWW1_9BURK|nr:PLP-dependent aminotransferase family protein [Pigmentiphaga aceris]QEI06665.1 PLP-dependent aminotransferase family protein [Pigmentiphaga aceris]